MVASRVICFKLLEPLPLPLFEIPLLPMPVASLEPRDILDGSFLLCPTDFEVDSISLVSSSSLKEFVALNVAEPLPLFP